MTCKNEKKEYLVMHADARTCCTESHRVVFPLEFFGGFSNRLPPEAKRFAFSRSSLMMMELETTWPIAPWLKRF